METTNKRLRIQDITESNDVPKLQKLHGKLDIIRTHNVYYIIELEAFKKKIKEQIDILLK